jgi:hypothetical protein
MEKRLSILEYFRHWVTYSWVVLTAATLYIIISIGKKISQFLFEAAVDKIIRSLEDIISEVVKKEIKPVRKNLHGAIQKNEAVLLEALNKIDRLENKNKESDK